MAVGAVPNVVYVVKAVRAEFERVSTATGYWTDVATVDQPSYPQDAIDAVFAEKSPAILIWPDYEEQRSESTSAIHPVLRLFVIGTAKRDRGLQDMLMNLATDIRRVMLMNPSRDHPDNTGANTWGRYTRQAGVIDYRFRRVEGQSCGAVLTSWDIEYNHTMAKG